MKPWHVSSHLLQSLNQTPILQACKDWSTSDYPLHFQTQIKGKYLPAGMGRLSLQDVLGEGWRLQLILVKGKLVYDHGLTIHTGEPHHRMSCAWRLKGGKGYQFAHIYGKQTNSLKIIHKQVFHHPIRLKTLSFHNSPLKKIKYKLSQQNIN